MHERQCLTMVHEPGDTIFQQLISFVPDREFRRFCATCASGIERHQKDAMEGVSAASISRATSSWLSTWGRCRTFFG